MKTLFVTGTDTGVGKTVITAVLVRALRSAGVDAGVMKPIASGCAETAHGLESEDALLLRDLTGVDDELDLINPVRWVEPLAPLVAARRAGKSTADTLPRVFEALSELGRRHHCVVVEGVGGLMAPIAEGATGIVTCRDLAEQLACPVVVVARRTLGTINHSVLTTQVALQRPSYFAGLVFSDSSPVADGDIAANTSPALIEEMTGLRNWGCLPHLAVLDAARLDEAAHQFKDEVRKALSQSL